MTIETTLVPGAAWPYPSKEAVALALQVTDRAKKRRDEVAPKAAKTAKAESTITDHGRKLLRAKLMQVLRNGDGADLVRLVGVDGRVSARTIQVELAAMEREGLVSRHSNGRLPQIYRIVPKEA